MKKILFVLLGLGFVFGSIAQNEKLETSPDPTGIKAISSGTFIDGKKQFCTRVKDQERTGTCWSFSTTSLVESQVYKNRLGAYDISEMFSVRNMYIEKAKNYVLRQGHAQFSEGALGHDLIRSIATYGTVTEQAYNGLANGEKVYDHEVMFKELNKYLDSTIKTKGRSLSAEWLPGYNKILDKYMGPLPESFSYNGQRYTPKSFAKNLLKFTADDYANITSFTHHPNYQSFVLEVPDNFSNGAYFNVPLNEMITVVENAVQSGFTVLWDTDVSNNGFNGKKGMAMNIKSTEDANLAFADPDFKEEAYDANKRQQLFENLTTQDDHLMHIVGIEKTKGGKTFFIVKNSWGEIGPYNGYVHVSAAYFAMNTISVVLPKAAISLGLREKMNAR